MCAADIMSSLQLVNHVSASVHSCHLVWQQLTFTAACVPLGLIHSLGRNFWASAHLLSKLKANILVDTDSNSVSICVCHAHGHALLHTASGRELLACDVV